MTLYKPTTFLQYRIHGYGFISWETILITPFSGPFATYDYQLTNLHVNSEQTLNRKPLKILKPRPLNPKPLENLQINSETLTHPERP